MCIRDREDTEKKPSIEVQVMIDSMSACVLNYVGRYHAESTDEVPLSDLTFKDMTVDYCAYTNSSFSSEIKVDYIGFVDTRPDTDKVFRNLLGQGKGKTDKEAPMFLFRFEKLVETQQVATRMTLDTPQIIIVLDHLFALKTFFSDGLSQKEFCLLYTSM